MAFSAGERGAVMGRLEDSIDVVLKIMAEEAAKPPISERGAETPAPVPQEEGSKS